MSESQYAPKRYDREFWPCLRCSYPLTGPWFLSGTCPRCDTGIVARLRNLAREAWDFWRTPEEHRRDYEFYIAKEEVRHWWRTRVYSYEACCGVRHIFGRFTIGKHGEDCDDLPF